MSAFHESPNEFSQEDLERANAQLRKRYGNARIEMTRNVLRLSSTERDPSYSLVVQGEWSALGWPIAAQIITIPMLKDLLANEVALDALIEGLTRKMLTINSGSKVD